MRSRQRVALVLVFAGVHAYLLSSSIWAQQEGGTITLRFRPRAEAQLRLRVYEDTKKVDRTHQWSKTKEIECEYDWEVGTTDREGVFSFLETRRVLVDGKPITTPTPFLMDGRRMVENEGVDWISHPLVLPFFPEDPVHVGDEWTVDAPHIYGEYMASAAMTVHCRFRLVRVFEEAGSEMAEIDWSYDSEGREEALSGRLSGKGSAIVLVENGQILRKEYESRHWSRLGDEVEVAFDVTTDVRYLIRVVE